MFKTNGAIVCAWLAFAGSGQTAERATLELVQTIALKGASGKLDHLALDAGQSPRLFVANKANNTLDVVDLTTGKLEKQIPDQGKISGLSFAFETGVLATGNGDGVCNVFLAPKLELAYSLKFPKADNVQYCARTNQFYVEHAEKKLTAFDAKTGEVKATIELPGTPEGFEIDSGGEYLYMCTQSPDLVAVIDIRKNEVAAKHALSLAAKDVCLALDEKKQVIYVGCRAKPMIVGIDLKTGKEVSSVGIPGDIDDLFFDAKRHRLYAICGEGAVGVVEQKEGGTLELIEKVPTANLARTGLFDAKSGKLYIAVPRKDETEGPQVRVYQARP